MRANRYLTPFRPLRPALRLQRQVEKRTWSRAPRKRSAPGPSTPMGAAKASLYGRFANRLRRGPLLLFRTPKAEPSPLKEDHDNLAESQIHLSDYPIGKAE